MTDLFLLDNLSLEVVDVADAHVDKLFERKLLQTQATGPVGLLKTSTNRKGGAVSVARDRACVGMDVGVSIYPNHMQISELLQ